MEQSHFDTVVHAPQLVIMMKVIDAPSEPVKTGVLYKQGGTDGGHKNWKQRFFVLTDHLAYYPSGEPGLLSVSHRVR